MGKRGALCGSRISGASSTEPILTALDRRRVPFLEAELMPVGVGSGNGAGVVEPGDLVSCQSPADSAEVLAELLFVASAEDNGGYRRPLHQPVEGDLGNAFVGFERDLVEGVYDSIKVFFGDRRADVASDFTLQPADL